MAGIIHLSRGVHLCVPRNMTQAAGFYNTLLRGDDPAIVIEVLNGYRSKEKLPANIGDFTLPVKTVLAEDRAAAEPASAPQIGKKVLPHDGGRHGQPCRGLPACRISGRRTRPRECGLAGLRAVGRHGELLSFHCNGTG